MPKTIEADSPEATDASTSVGELPEVSPAAQRRCDDAADAIDTLYCETVDFVDSGERTPPGDLLRAIEDLLEVVAREPSIAWPQATWQFLLEVSRLATVLAEHGGEAWRESFFHLRVPLAKAVARSAGQVAQLRDPKAPEPRVVELESIADLREEKVSVQQIAEIYGWKRDDGEPDTKKVRQCLAGEVEAPATKTYPPTITGPKRQPPLWAVDSLAQQIAMDREAAL